MKEGRFKLYIYYIGEEYPMTVERGAVEDLDRWLRNKNNAGNLKNCRHWIIYDGVTEVKRGGVALNIEII
jgi:hypothetical protein